MWKEKERKVIIRFTFVLFWGKGYVSIAKIPKDF